jgi:thioredoxin 1
MADVKYVNEEKFKTEVLESTLPVLVDFTAPWCGPCKMVDPIIHQLADEWDGTVKVLKCNADENPNVLVTYGVMGLPTVLLFKNGQMVERASGYQPKNKLIAKLQPHL